MENIHPNFSDLVSREEKESFLNQKSAVFWLTGLSGSGKSSIARLVERSLFAEGFLVQVLDGDNIRTGINNNLGFSLKDREENIRRIAEVSKLLINSGIICINCFVSPTEKIRQKAKNIIGEADFFEIYINSTLEQCEKRDPKGLYAKARSGELKGFTGIDSPYEIPQYPDLSIDTTALNLDQSFSQLKAFILEKI